MTSSSLSAPGGSTAARATVPAVELFATGTFDGQTFDEGFLDKVIANHVLLSTGDKPLHRPPVVLGHEEDQEWLTRTDLPAAGWVGGKVWKNAEGLLLGDFTDVPGPVADAINGGAFKKVSCEFYDDFVDNAGKHYGPALRRVALLGAEIPKVKGLADLPHAQFSDNLPARRVARVLKFAEGKPVPDTKAGGLQEMAKKILKDAGISEKTIGMLEGNEELMAALVADLQGGGTPDPAADPNADPAMMSEAAKKAEEAAVKKFSERAEALEKRNREIEARQAALEQKTREREAEEERRTIYTFAETLLAQKRIAPSELDESDPRCLSLPQRLLALDNATVRKFSEDGKDVSLTPRQLEIERLRKLPQRQFSERVAAGKGKDDLADLAKRTQEYVKANAARRQPAGKN